MIQFSCTCGKQLAAEEQHAGKAVKCPQCGNNVNIPGGNSGVQPPPNYGAPPSQHQQEYPQQQQGQPQHYQSTPPQYQQPQQYQQPPQGRGGGDYDDFEPRRRRRDRKGSQSTNGMALASFICGLLSLCIPFITGLMAVLFGFIGLGATGEGKQQGRGFAITGLILGFLTLVLQGIGSVYAFYAVQAAADRMVVINDMKQMGIAMHAYHDARKQMPQQAIYSDDGRPLLSWRVKILPYMEQGHLYKQFHMDEPWDSPHNKSLLSQMPIQYQHPLDPAANKQGLTHYQVFVTPSGPQHGVFVASPNAAQFRSRIHEMMDGSSNTITIVEAANPVPWTKPEDITFSPNGNNLSKLGRLHSGSTCLFTFADGSVRPVDLNQLDETNLRNLILQNDGNTITIP